MDLKCFGTYHCYHMSDCCSQLDMVLEPGGLHNQLVTGTSSGELKFVDFRVVDSGGQMGVWKTVEAHTKGAMTAMAAHPYSPLLATATATQVHGQTVRLFCTHKSGCVTSCMAMPDIPVAALCTIYVTNQVFTAIPILYLCHHATCRF